MPWVDQAWGFMGKAVFYNVVDDLIGWREKCRIEFAERGEPSYNKHLPDFIRYARAKLPKIQMMVTTNGDNINHLGPEGYEAWVRDLMDDGLNIIMIDGYDEERYSLLRNLFPDADLFYEDSVHPYKYHSPKHKQIILVGEVVGRAQDGIRVFQNMGGSVDVARAIELGYRVTDTSEPLKKMCVRPFREIVIHYDGAVPLCCNDWKEEGIIGSVLDSHLFELWDAMDDARRLLIAKDRASLMPCAVCSERAGFRVGLEVGWFNKDGVQ
jgi:hypothetical protein